MGNTISYTKCSNCLNSYLRYLIFSNFVYTAW